jgi:hypothetical protein
MGYSILTLSLALCILVSIVLVIRRQGFGSPVLYVSVVYFYLSFGAVIVYLLGGEVYFGIREEYIPQAAVIFLLAQLGLYAGALAAGLPSKFDMRIHNASVRTSTALPWVLIFLASVTIFLMAVVLSAPASGKTGSIDFIGTGVHYPLLTFQRCAMCLYFLVRFDPGLRRIYWANASIYVAYCLVMDERDFIFTFASILAFKVMLREVRFGPRVILFGVIGVVLGSLLGFIRSEGGEFDWTSILGQNSILFINTNVLYLFPDTHDFQQGLTYVNAFLTIVPGFFWPDQPEMLTTWFKNWFAPSSRSSYGFALDAEAYLNFGFVGVPFVFAAWSLVLYWLARRFDRHAFYSFASLYFLSGIMYSVRNESWTIIHSCVYAGIFFLAVQTRKKPQHESVSLSGNRICQQNLNT